MLPDLYGSIGRTDGNNYYASTGVNSESIDVQLSIITMADNLPCKNCLWWGEEYLVNQLQYLGEAMRPEVALAKKYKSQMSDARHVLRVKCVYTEVMPYDFIEYEDATYAVIAVSHDYYENETTLTIIEL